MSKVKIIGKDKASAKDNNKIKFVGDVLHIGDKTFNPALINDENMYDVGIEINSIDMVHVQRMSAISDACASILEVAMLTEDTGIAAFAVCNTGEQAVNAIEKEYNAMLSELKITLNDLDNAGLTLCTDVEETKVRVVRK